MPPPLQGGAVGGMEPAVPAPAVSSPPLFRHLRVGLVVVVPSEVVVLRTDADGFFLAFFT